MLTIVIPTKNRVPFLKRLLRYYMDVRCPFHILIGDSSNSDQMKEFCQFLSREVGNRLKIKHLIDPGVQDVHAKGWQTDSFMRGLIDYVKTPYVAFYADDDFAIVPNLQKAVDFLETHSDFSFVCGEAILFTLKSQGAIGEVEGTSYYRQSSFEQSKASQRLWSLFSNYAVLEYGVSRTAQKKMRWSTVLEAEVNNFVGELINTGLVPIQGKVCKMDELLLVRQGHDLQSSKISIADCDWALKIYSWDSVQKLVEIFSKELIKVEKDLGGVESNAIIKKSLCTFFAPYMSPPGTAKSIKKSSLYDRLLDAFRKNRIMKKIGLSIYSHTSSGKMKLPALLRDTSLYHADFMPVYRAITKIRS
ncbi:MAG: TIGR00180 family glycosyltransferase [Deltaproteobacteria bacterium]|nr:TIGR00180 family glycosyltransferase [Deltaproteobacteria bacterium]